VHRATLPKPAIDVYVLRMTSWRGQTARMIGLRERPSITPAERALLDAVIAAPDDRVPRLIYADWLLEREDPELHARGELIHIQCELDVQLHGADPALRSREHDLLDRWGHVWCSAIGFGAMLAHGPRWDCDFRGGFAERVRLAIEELPKVATKLFTQEPVRWLTLTHWDRTTIGERLRRTAQMKYLKRVHGLALVEFSDNPALAEIAAELEQLHALHFDSSRITNSTAIKIATKAPRALKELSLRRNAITGDAMAELAAALPPQLHELDLSNNDLGDDGAHALAASRLDSLTRINLADTRITRDGRAVLVARWGDAISM
jgi:uncharacterized protein (TIGR02996 family)